MNIKKAAVTAAFFVRVLQNFAESFAGNLFLIQPLILYMRTALGFFNFP
jgi:hypothetical protein